MDSRIIIDPQVRKKIFQKYHGRCYYCGQPLTIGESTIDHFVALAKGGSNSINNFVLSCGDCNILKKDRSLEDFKIYMYSLMANALRYLNQNLYNQDTGEFKFFGELNKDTFEKISDQEINHLNKIMKTQDNTNSKKSQLTYKLQRVVYDNAKPFRIDNIYDNKPIDDNPIPDPKWENTNTLVEKAFISMLENFSIKDTISVEETTLEKDLAKESISNEVVEDKIIENEEIVEEQDLSTQNFVICKDELIKPIEIKKVHFSFTKKLSSLSYRFMQQVKSILENTDYNETEQLRTFYILMDDRSISEKQYANIAKELTKKGIINKHRKFKPNIVEISRIKI